MLVFSHHCVTLLSGQAVKRNTDNRLWLKSLSVVFFACGLFVAGCSRLDTPAGQELTENPYARKAKQAAQNRDFVAAAALYRKALRVNPDLAAAHLELGLLSDDKLGDPISAIYHYRRFLELQPASPKRPLVEDFIERAKLNLLTKLGPVGSTSSSSVAWQEEKAKLLEQNAALQARILELEKLLAQSVASGRSGAQEPVGRATIPAPASAVVTSEATGPRVHTVQPRDTLQSLALRYYGSRSEWTKIYAANRHHLPSKDELKVGQQLIIP